MTVSNDDTPPDFARDFALVFQDETPVEFVSTRLGLWCLMSAVQLAARHPDAERYGPMKIAISMARAIQERLSTTPALARIAEQGWDLSDANEPRTYS